MFTFERPFIEHPTLLELSQGFPSFWGLCISQHNCKKHISESNELSRLKNRISLRIPRSFNKFHSDHEQQAVKFIASLKHHMTHTVNWIHNENFFKIFLELNICVNQSDKRNRKPSYLQQMKTSPCIRFKLLANSFNGRALIVFR